MRLSPELLQHLAPGMDANGANPDVEKRRSPRVDVSLSVTVIPCGSRADRRPFSARLINISETGVAMRNTPPLRRGDEFVLRFPPTAGQPFGAVLCSVVYSRLTEGAEVVGAQYVRVLDVANPAPPLPDGASPEEQDHLRQLQLRLMGARDKQ